MNSPLVPVSWGELIDKITILEIKAERMSGSARANVKEELRLLEQVAEPVRQDDGVRRLSRQLRDVNERLWEIEDRIRAKERQEDFGPQFVALARSVYKENDRRAALKREINLALRSSLIEEKSYDRASIFFRSPA